MFRTMRRKNQQLPDDACQKVLCDNTYGVLAMLGDDGYPYSVPLNYIVEGGHIYLHCSVEGHKTDALKNTDKASFCVVDKHDIDPAHLTTRYRSVIAFGRISLVADEEKRKHIITRFCDRLAPGQDEMFAHEMKHFFPIMHIMDFAIEHMTGKEEKNMAAERKKAMA